jgi:hypothetical protein
MGAKRWKGEKIMMQAIVEDGYAINALNMQTWGKQYISPSIDNPATVLSSDDNGMALIEFNTGWYLVQSIDLEYPE